jgi:hypothetical protein
MSHKLLLISEKVLPIFLINNLFDEVAQIRLKSSDIKTITGDTMVGKCGRVYPDFMYQIK